MLRQRAVGRLLGQLGASLNSASGSPATTAAAAAAAAATAAVSGGGLPMAEGSSSRGDQQQQQAARGRSSISSSYKQQPAASMFLPPLAALQLQQMRGKATDAAAAAAAAAAMADADGQQAAVTEAAADAADGALGLLGEVLGQADAILQVSDAATVASIAAAKASVWMGTRTFMDLMLWVHDGIGIPWFEAIAVTNLLVKLLTLPLPYLQQRVGPKMAALRTDTQAIHELTLRLQKVSSPSEYMLVSEELSARRAEYYRKHTAFDRRMPFITPVLGVGQMVVFVSQFSAISTLATAKIPSMTYEGALWFPDLTVPDPLYGLPILCAATTLAMVSSPRFMENLAAAGSNANVFRKLTMFAALAFVPAGGYASSAIALLWTINAAFTMAQNSLFGNPAVRAVLDLPPTKPAAAAAAAPGSGGKATSSSGGSFWGALVGDSSSGSSKPKPAAAVGAPPPGAKKAGGAPQQQQQQQQRAPPIRPGIAVSYSSTRPKRKPRGGGGGV